MEGTAVFVVLALLGSCVQGQDLMRKQTTFTMPTTTEMPTVSTAISLSPQTSISVHHTIVRNQPAYPYPYTESPHKTDATDDSSYYYTYEDVSEEASKMVTSTVNTPTTTTSTTKPAVKSFWNSQKAMLDQRRKESAQKFKPTYTKPSIPKENKPTIEFKVREKPKFGQSNRYKSAFTTATTTTKNLEVTSPKPVESSTSAKAVKTEFTLNLPISKLPQKDLLKHSLKTLNSFTNQIVGRVGEIPAQTNQAPQIQSPIRAQSTIVNSFGSANPSKLDDSVANVQFIDNIRKLQQDIQNTQALRNNLQQQQALLTNLKSQPLLGINQPQLNNQQPRSNAQPILNLNNNQQPLQNSINSQPGNTFIAATAPIGTSARSATGNGQQPSQASSLLQRLGSLGLNGGNNGLSNAILGRDGGGNGLTLNLGPVSDPLSVFLRLISLIPRPLLDLNGKIFFGIELGKNAGLVSGSAAGGKPAYNG